ncbi:glycosyltransferase family 4 protein [Saccharospirillum alexandrii]|uniref:glycosyltransferase family 4 protein n=1 Tax=Saccharospirillum alexandrii TaxID=2448477 RepID=UPI003735449D
MGNYTMKKPCILIMLHCEQDTGYAIGSLERAFEAAALRAGYESNQILWSYTQVVTPSDKTFQMGYYTSEDAEMLASIHKVHTIDTILAFDMPYPTPVGRQAHILGIKNIVSYWGASMSSINTGVKWLAKKAEWIFRKASAPTRFIFESEAMRLTATKGRGVPNGRTCVISLGVDTDLYKPCEGSKYAHSQFNIPEHRRIIFFSGHMEERKGVRVLVETMNSLDRIGKIEPFHLLICGNKGNESLPYEQLASNPKTRSHITFAGYRNDIPQLMQSSFLGAIASTGWDSFTMSSVEMLSSGLPIIVSELQGLKETIEPGICGEYIEPGKASQLAQHILNYNNDPDRYTTHCIEARRRATNLFSKETQIERIAHELISGRSRNQHTETGAPSKSYAPEGPQ